MAGEGAGVSAMPQTGSAAGASTTEAEVPPKKTDLTLSTLGKAVFKALSSVEPATEDGYLAKTAEAHAKNTLKTVASLGNISGAAKARVKDSVHHAWRCQDCGVRGEGGTKNPKMCSDTSGKWTFYWGCCNCALDKHGWSKYESHGCKQVTPFGVARTS